jgi:hypothetical protein
MPADQIPTEFGRNPDMVRSWPDLAKMAGIRSDMTGSGGVLPDSAKHARRNPATVATVAFSFFVIFLCELNAEKYF